jgi:hypothetical protein
MSSLTHLAMINTFTMLRVDGETGWPPEGKRWERRAARLTVAIAGWLDEGRSGYVRSTQGDVTPDSGRHEVR